MKVNEVKYMKRVNLGNYEHEELTVSVLPEENEKFDTTFGKLKAMVNDALSGKVTKPQYDIPETPAANIHVENNTSETDKELAHKPAKKTKPTKKVEEEVAAGTKVQEEVAAPAPAKAANKGKVVVYNRDIEDHKNVLGQLLDKSLGKSWRTKGSKEAARAVAFSKQLVGTPFLDANGNVLDSVHELLESV